MIVDDFPACSSWLVFNRADQIELSAYSGSGRVRRRSLLYF
jgi:hypothetical protein